MPSGTMIFLNVTRKSVYTESVTMTDNGKAVKTDDPYYTAHRIDDIRTMLGWASSDQCFDMLLADGQMYTGFHPKPMMLRIPDEMWGDK